MSVQWGQLVVGPPGSGKTTYCKAMLQFLASLDRNPIVVNLDPANDELPYACPIDIKELISVDDAMEALELGPNGGLVYCIEFLEKNMDWLEGRLAEFPEHYFVFDCPGQAELYTHHSSFANIVKRLMKPKLLRLAAVHLVDVHHCADAGKFFPAVLLSLSTMMRLELPHVNVLSKADMLESGKITVPFDTEYYTDLGDNMWTLLSTLPGRSPEDDFDGEEEYGGEGGATVSAGGVGGSGSGVEPTCGGGGDGGGEGDDDGDDDPAAAAAAAKAAAIEAARRRRSARFFERYTKLTETLAGVIEDYSMVSFVTLNIEDKTSVATVVERVDKCNGFIRMSGHSHSHHGGMPPSAPPPM